MLLYPIGPSGPCHRGLGVCISRAGENVSLGGLIRLDMTIFLYSLRSFPVEQHNIQPLLEAITFGPGHF